MKVKTCSQCKKEIEKKLRDECLRNEYQYMTDTIESAVQHSMVGVVAALEKKGLSKQYIKKFFEDMCLIFDMPTFGKKVLAKDLKKRYEKEYGISFDSIKVHFESEEEFVKENK